MATYQSVGTVYNYLEMGFADQSFFARDFGADGSLAYLSDSGYNYYPGVSASTISITERPAAAVPEPTTMAGLALAGAGVAAARRRKQRKTSA